MAVTHVEIRDVNEKIWQKIKEEVEHIEYGSVTITVHDGKIVQIESSVKQRFI